MKGAKAEILDTPEGINWDLVLKAVAAVAEIGLFSLAVFLDRKHDPQPSTVIVNNYISKGD